MTIGFGREVTGSLALSESKEWLVTNGLGSFAMGTISGILTRRYHGLLIAALNPPIGRTLLATKIEEEILYNDIKYQLSSNRWGSQEISPIGFIHIERFILDGQIPTWTYALGDALIEKKIWMEQGAHITYVLYKVLRASSTLAISLKCLVNHRGYHQLTRANSWKMDVAATAKGFLVRPFEGAHPFTFESEKGKAVIDNIWYGNYYLSMEKQRGLDYLDDNLLAGTFNLELKTGDQDLVIINAEKEAPESDPLKRRQDYQNSLIVEEDPWWIRQLKSAADQFIVNRKNGKTIIAGYPWFTDWGRDTLVSLSGLTLSTKRYDIAKSILNTYAQYINEGMLPNRFTDEGVLEYNTVDAALWYFKAIRDTFDATNDTSFLAELYPKLQDIIDWTLKGTRYNIHVDPQDSLLYAGVEGMQLTWMDIKIGSYVVTPRIGKPVEVNALWYYALRTMSYFSSVLKIPKLEYDARAELCKKGFERFFNNQSGFCYDVLDGPAGNDATLRPNQLIALSLKESPLTKEQQLLVLENVGKTLYTTYGIRTLSPTDPNYRGHYGGDQLERDSAYHQGTAWGFLLGIYVQAHFNVHGNTELAKQLLSPIPFHLMTAGLGSYSEIFDGDAPMNPKGCIAQAWSVGTILEAYALIEGKK